jgi:hypothetical protein
LVELQFAVIEFAGAGQQLVARGQNLARRRQQAAGLNRTTQRVIRLLIERVVLLGVEVGGVDNNEITLARMARFDFDGSHVVLAGCPAPCWPPVVID